MFDLLRILNWSFIAGPFYLLGGGLHGEPGLMGCLGDLSIDGRQKVLWEGYNEESSQRAGLHYTGLFVPGVKWPGLTRDNPLNIYTNKQNTIPHNPQWLSLFWNFLNISGACCHSPPCVKRQNDDILEWKQNSFQATSDFELSSEADIVIGQCGLTNKCADISCEHGGTCRHVSIAPHVYCDCDNTGGYTGATCRTSNTWRSCGQYLEFTGERSVLAITRTDWNNISL